MQKQIEIDSDQLIDQICDEFEMADRRSNFLLAAGANHSFGDACSRMRLNVASSGTIIGLTGSRYERSLSLTGATVTGPVIVDGDLNINTTSVSNVNSGSTMTVAGQTNVNQGTLRINSGATVTGAGALAVKNLAFGDR